MQEVHVLSRCALREEQIKNTDWFRGAAHEFIQSARRQPGCLDYYLLARDNRPEIYYIYSSWLSDFYWNEYLNEGHIQKTLAFKNTFLKALNIVPMKVVR